MTSPPDAPSAPPLSQEAPSYNWAPATWALIVGTFMVFLDSSIVNVAIPAMEQVFGVGTDRMEWVATAYLLTLGVVSPISGWLADRIGFKRLYLLGIVTFTLGSVLAALSPDLALLIGARTVQAVGGGVIPAVTTALIFTIVPRDRLGLANSMRGVALLVGPILGPVLGGYLVQYVDWRWIFLINLPIGLIGLAVGAATIPEIHLRPQSRFDGWGFVTSTTGLVALLLALTDGRTYGWSSPFIVFLLAVTAFTLVAFVIIELNVPEPMIDLSVLRLGTFTASLAYIGIIQVTLFSGLFFLPVFLELVRGEGAMHAGLTMIPGTAVIGLVMPLAGFLYDRYGARWLVVAGTLLLAAGVWLFHQAGIATSDTAIAEWWALAGAGAGLAMMPSLTAGLVVVPQEALARASALRNVVQRVAGSFGIAVLTTILYDGIARDTALITWGTAIGSPSGARLGALTRSAPPTTAAGRALLAALMQRIGNLAFVHTFQGMFAWLALLASLGIVPAFFLGRGSGRKASLRTKEGTQTRSLGPAGIEA